MVLLLRFSDRLVGGLSSFGRNRRPFLDIVEAIPKNGFVMVPRVPLETERLRLEPVSGGYAEALHQAVIDSRPELLQWMPWARAPNIEGGREAAARSEAAWRDGHEFHFVVVERSTDEVLGVAGLNRERELAAELHYWIRSGHTGVGFATEAGRALIKWAPGALGVSRLTL
jgi:ribosomal-protein-serine acetyltransferase